MIEYDGTNYCGWQRQKELPTIQEFLENGLCEITGENVVVFGAGRTDSGVHARGQTAHFKTASHIPGHAFAKALNTALPSDIVVRESQEVPMDFHAQFSAKAKAYRYTLYNHEIKPAIQRNYVHWVWRSLDVEKMKQASVHLIGTHDFSSFEAANSPRKSNIRTVNYIDITKESCYIEILIEANGFLYKMVRNIVGTLISVGHRQHEPDHTKTVLEARDRKRSGSTAPAKGLCLEYVAY